MKPGRPAKNAGAAAPAQRILDAASSLFLERGFEAVSTDELARAASVSKSTIYRHFGDMPGVFTAVVERAGDVFNAGVNAAPGTRQELRDALIRYGTNLLVLLNTDFCQQLDKVLHEEARRHPEIARQFYDAAYGRAHREVARLLADARSQGAIELATSPEVLADNLISMWEGLSYVRARLGLQPCPFPEPDAWSRHCVSVLFPE